MTRNRPTLVRYGIAAGLIALTVTGRSLLDPALGDQLGIAFLFLSILVAAWTGGFGPAALVSIGGLLSMAFFFPQNVLDGQDAGALGLVVYVVITFGIGLLGSGMSAARRRTEAVADRLRITLSSIGDNVHDLREAKAALDTALQAATIANRSRNEFLANMSHEIRTPMTAILGYTEMLAKNLRDPDDVHCVRTIQRNGEFLLEIINDILDISKIEAGKQIIEPTTFSLIELLGDVNVMIAHQAAEKNLEFHIECSSPIPQKIHSDPIRLRQVIFNLLGNAIKFTEVGQVRLIVDFKAENAMLEFNVVDTGVGISKEHQVHLFEPFVQADASVTRKFGGTGLGLAISQRIVAMLGGEIFLESAPGQGSSFRFSIKTGGLENQVLVPFLLPNPEPVKEDSPLPQLTCRVLVVDDRRDVRYLAQHFLEEVGAQIVTANNGREAIELLERLKDTDSDVDVVLMDMQMPEMDGYEATILLRQSGFSRPIIALTANAMKGDQENCLAAGCDAFISKPIVGKTLVRFVSQFAEKSKGRTKPPPARDLG